MSKNPFISNAIIYCKLQFSPKKITKYIIMWLHMTSSWTINIRGLYVSVTKIIISYSFPYCERCRVHLKLNNASKQMCLWNIYRDLILRILRLAKFQILIQFNSNFKEKFNTWVSHVSCRAFRYRVLGNSWKILYLL